MKKIMFQSKKLKSSCDVRHKRKFRLTHFVIRSVHALKYASDVIAERAIHLTSSTGRSEFWPEPMKFLADMLNRTHLLRIKFVYLLQNG